MKYKNYNIPDEEVDKLMDKLDLSLADACEMWLSDHDVVKNETVEELTTKATKNRVTSTIHAAKGDKKARKPREKKENPLKKQIIAKIYSVLKDFDNVIVRNDEKYIDFDVNGLEFTVNLVQHRKKKT